MITDGNRRRLPAQEFTQLRADLDEKGYSVLRNVIPRAPLSDFNAQLNQAYEQARKFDGGGTIMGHLNCFPGESARFIYDQLNDRGIVDFVHSMRPDQPNDVLARVNWNLPGSSAQHYHMDSAFTNEWIVCNIAIIDIDHVNGPMDILPGTHRQFYPYWRFAVERKAKLSTLLLMDPGDVVVRRSTVWHRGTPNQSGAVRPLMSLSFGEPGAPEGDPFVANGAGITFYPNWYSNATRKDVLRERMERAFPITRSTARFVKSIIRPHGYDGY